MIAIVNVQEFSGGIDPCARYIHAKWGDVGNYPFYYDAIVHSSGPGKQLPRFYVLVKDNALIGCYALLTNDLISRQDLYPWFACLFVEENERGHQYGKLMLAHAEQEAANGGFSMIYLNTSHDGYYEKYGWQRIEDGYYINGSKLRIYEHEVGA
jgi:GNAT superfamily N-acetyltransferase